MILHPYKTTLTDEDGPYMCDTVYARCAGDAYEQVMRRHFNAGSFGSLKWVGRVLVGKPNEIITIAIEEVTP
jgi:hypothetical protein